MSEIDMQAQIDAGWNNAQPVLESRTIVFNAFITEATANDLIGHLLMLDKLAQEPIVPRLTTEGGQVYGGLAIYDTIRHLRAPVITLAEHLCGGFGLVILMAGGKRYALPNSRLVYTPIEGMLTGMMSDRVIHSREVNRLSGILARIVQSHAVEPNALRRLFSGGKPPWDFSVARTFTPDEARRYRIIDSVVRSAAEIPR